MRKLDYREALVVLKTISEELIATAKAGASSGAELRKVCGELVANAATLIREGSIGTQIVTCFRAAYDADSTLDSLDRFRVVLLGLKVKGEPAKVLVRAAVICACSGIARRMSETTLKSKTDLDLYLTRLNNAFLETIDIESDENSQETYRTLSTLHANVVQDLVRRGRTLPQIIPYSFPTPRPALWIANRFYGDAARSDELIAENRVVHPLFMPTKGRAFSV